MKCIIAGSRSFNDAELLRNKCDLFFKDKLPEEIVSGGAKGADYLGEQYAAHNKIRVKRFLADWSKNGRAAGYIRNKEMAEYATHLIVFWDGESNGTKNMIKEAEKLGLEIRIVKYRTFNYTHSH